MVDHELVSRKLARLKGYLLSLREAADITWDKYQRDARAKAFVERYLHLAIEEGLDARRGRRDKDAATRTFVGR